MQVVLAKYDPPTIKCDTTSTPGPSWESCVSLFSNMRAYDRLRVFGSYDQEDIEEGLPLVLEAGKYHLDKPYLLQIRERWIKIL